VPAKGEAPKGGAVIFFCDTKYTIKSVSCVEAGMGMEGQIVRRTMPILDVTSSVSRSSNAPKWFAPDPTEKAYSAAPDS